MRNIVFLSPCVNILLVTYLQVKDVILLRFLVHCHGVGHQRHFSLAEILLIPVVLLNHAGLEHIASHLKSYMMRNKSFTRMSR